MARSKKTDKQIAADKYNSTMMAVALWTSFYRENPQRFAKDFLGLNLKLFQKIILWLMVHVDNFFFVATRGIGKTYMIALYATIKCILFPGTKCVCCSYTFKQAKEIVLKITDDFMQKSALLRNEISKYSTSQNDCYVYFKNGSFIKCVTAGESARGGRSNLLIIDESRLVPQKIVDKILRPMNVVPRQPGYLNNPEYSHLKEMNQEFYLSSAYYVASEMFKKFKAYFANMLNPNLKYFVCDLPYMLSIKEDLLMRQSVLNEMNEKTFDEITFSMERKGEFYGSSDDALFDLNVLNNCRKIPEPLFDLDFYEINKLKMPSKKQNEIRVLSVDIALLGSKKHDNDASSIQIHSGIPTTSNIYRDNIVYIGSEEDILTEELGLIIMRYYYQYNCDYIAIDATGVGQSVLDYLMNDRFDPKFNQNYPALNVINNDILAERCKVPNAPKVIFAIKANSVFNNDNTIALRSGFQNGNINLLKDIDFAKDYISNNIKGYNKLSDYEKENLLMPYLQTTFLVNELINLTHTISDSGAIKVKERSGMRKDRYSSCMYGYYVMLELSKNLKSTTPQEEILDILFNSMQRGNYYGKKV